MLTVALLSAACGGRGAGGGGDRISVVASFYPLAEAAERIGGDRVEVTNLTRPGVEPHDLELSPDQVERIATADVVLYLNRGFQPAVEDAVSTVAEGTTLDLLEGLPARPGAPGQPRDEEGAVAGEVVDPHVWLSPVLMRRIADRIEGALVDADPAGAGAFAGNGRGYAKALAALDARFRAGLAQCDRHTIVTSHAAFGYLAEEYGLLQRAVAGLSPEAEPDAKRLAELADEIRGDGTTTVFSETLVSPKVAETLAEEAGAATAVLDPIEGLSQEQIESGEDYASIMRENLAALREGLGCV